MRLPESVTGKNRRFGVRAALLLAAAMCLFFLIQPAKAAADSDNLLMNGDFSQANAENFPLYWYADAYDGLSGSQFEVVQEADGPAAHIVNHYLKDARFAQAVSVTPGAYYCLHGYIRADATGGLGANLSVEGVAVYSDLVYDSQGEWQEVTLYGKTGESQDFVTVFVRLGGYSGEAEGEAYFRDVSLTQVDSVPSGYTAFNWYSASVNYDADYYYGVDTVDLGSRGDASLLLAGCAVLYRCFFVFLCRFLRRPRTEALEQEPKWKTYGILAGVLLCGLILRLILAANVSGYDVDIGCFTGWANGLAQSGPGGSYQ